ncbi:hypothetical protein Tco_0846750 [Tanacetum coccineum]
MDSENDNEKVNMPSFPPPEPTVSCFDDLDFFKDFENEFPAIVYNDALISKSDFLTEPTGFDSVRFELWKKLVMIRRLGTGSVMCCCHDDWDFGNNRNEQPGASPSRVMGLRTLLKLNPLIQDRFQVLLVRGINVLVLPKKINAAKT